jgi:hypothetical protein
MENLYCEFEKTGAQFNKRDIYKCKYCDIQLLLENPENSKVICFAKRDAINQTIDPNRDKVVSGLTSDNFEENILQHVLEKYGSADKFLKDVEQIKQAVETNNICSQEQINQRLKICSTCEYYENDSCLLCGCVVVRDANYKNKLAQKNQVCPTGKWGAIKD